MKKIIALALALIMALSMGSVAFAAATATPDVTFDTMSGAPGQTDINGNAVTYKISNTTVIAPGSTVEIDINTLTGANFDTHKISDVDFTTGKLEGASMIDSVKITKEKDAIRITLKESYTMALDAAKSVVGNITVKKGTVETVYNVTMNVNNKVAPVAGEKKASATVAMTKDTDFGKNIVTVMDEDGGYVKFTEDVLTGVVKMNKDEKTYLNITQNDKDTMEVIEEYLGEEYVDDATIEYYTFETRAFKNDVDFSYKAYEEDDHFFYVWDGEALKALDAKYDDDDEVEAYVWTAVADGTIVVTDTEVVLAAEEATKNPDTGANDVVGVAAALAVVSLVAAGAVSLKK